MSDQTPEPVQPKKERKERFSGEIDLDGFENSTVDLEALQKAGRPPEVDYSPYVRLVEQNYNQNKDRPKDDKIASGKTWKPEAVTTVKSRFGVAAGRLGVGLSWVETKLDNGFVQLDFVAGERTLRPRKDKTDESADGSTNVTTEASAEQSETVAASGSETQA